MPVFGASGRRLLTRTVAAVLVLVATFGCQYLGQLGGQADVNRAQAVLDHWDQEHASSPPDAVIVTDGLAAGGGWSGPNDNDHKLAFMAGLLTANPPLPTNEPPPGSIEWSDGSAQTVALMSAADALAAMVAAVEDQKCDGCTPLVVTGAHLTNGSRNTTRGSASLPVWQFEFGPADQPIDPITFVAVNGAVSHADDSFSSGSNNEWVNDDLQAAYGNAQSTSLTVTFVGAPFRGDNPCGADYGAQAVENDRAVAIVVTESHSVSTTGAACLSVGSMRTAVVQLSRPLGNRVILEIRFGTPVALKDEPPPPDRVTN